MRILWRNGEFTKDGFTESGFLQGNGVFETLRCEGSRVFALHRHMRRAIEAARSMGIVLPKEDVIESAISEVIHYGNLPLARLRALFSNQDFALAYESYRESREPIRVLVNETSFSRARRLKSYPYDDRLELLAHVAQQGWGEVLLHNTNGFITEGAVSNFLFRDRAGWFTTPLSHGMVPGVMRALYVEKCNIDVRPLALSDLGGVQAGFAISSLRLGQMISHLNHRELVLDEKLQAECDDLAKKMRQVAWDSSVLLTHG